MAKIHQENIKDNRENFNKEICDFKHSEIEKQFENIKEHINENGKNLKESILAAIKNVEEKIDSELKNKENNLKDKIIIVEKGVNEKIDALDDFTDSLKGNGDPGISERMRAVEEKIKYQFYLVAFILILLFGGEFWGVTVGSIKKYFSSSNTPTKEVQREETGGKAGEDKDVNVVIPPK